MAITSDARVTGSPDGVVAEVVAEEDAQEQDRDAERDERGDEQSHAEHLLHRASRTRHLEFCRPGFPALRAAVYRAQARQKARLSTTSTGKISSLPTTIRSARNTFDSDEKGA